MSPIVYIRATDLRPLYVLHEGKYFRVERHLSADKKPRLPTHFLRLGDFLEIEEPGRRLHIPVHFTTVFTDRVGLKGFAYA